MADVAERPVAKTAAGAAEARGAADAARDAGITFLLALALFGSIVGLRTDSANGGLEITTHFAKAAGLAAAVAALRFLLDILVWRPLDAGRTLAFLKQFAARAEAPRYRRFARSRPRALRCRRSSHRAYRISFRAILARRHAYRPCHLRMHRGVHRRICHAGRAGLAALFCALCPGPAGQAAGGAHCQIRARIPRSTSRRCGAPPVPHRGSAAALRGRYRDADFDLHHARLGLECGRRARRPARSWLCRLLRGRRL